MKRLRRPKCFDDGHSVDLVIGAHIHGIILALQAGVSGVCIVHGSRTDELCQTMHIPFVKTADYAHGMSRSEMARVFVFDAAAFDAIRKILAKRFIEFLESNNLTPSGELQALAV